MRGNTSGTTEHAIDNSARHVRLTVVTVAQSGGNVTRVYEFEAYA